LADETRIKLEEKKPPMIPYDSEVGRAIREIYKQDPDVATEIAHRLDPAAFPHGTVTDLPPSNRFVLLWKRLSGQQAIEDQERAETARKVTDAIRRARELAEDWDRTQEGT
jgi:hypothetical protein